MARYGVNVSSGSLPQPALNNRKQRPERATYLVALYALAVAITPEFTFLGIPKVRLTDLILPFLFLGSLSNFSSPGKGAPGARWLGRIGVVLLLWNFGALLLWGEAKLLPGLFYLAKRVIYLLVPVLVAHSLRSYQSWQRAIRTLVFAVPVLNLSVLQELRTSQSMGGVYATSEGMRASGIIQNQQTSTSLFIVLVCCLVLGTWNSFSDGWWRTGRMFSLLTGCAAVFATGSRGGMACLALSVVVFCFFNPKKLGLTITLAFFVALFGWSVTPEALRARLGGILPETQETFQLLVEDRSLSHLSGGSSIADRAIVAQIFMQRILPKAGLLGLGAGWKSLGSLDNFFLTEWMYHGLVGVSLCLLFLFHLLKYLFQAAFRSEDPLVRSVSTGVATGLVVMIASCIHGDTFYLIRPMECLALLVGLVAAGKRLARLGSPTS